MSNSRGANAKVVVDYMRKNPGRQTSREVSVNLPGVPFGTVSSVLSVEYAESMQHGGAGIYALRGPGNSSHYVWRAGRPSEDDLRPIRIMNHPRRSPAAKTPTTLLLTATQFSGIYRDPRGGMVRIQPVTVTIEDVQE